MSNEAKSCGHPRSVGVWRNGECRACHGVPITEAYGTPRSDVAVVAAAIERSRWVDAMLDVVADMERRESACNEIVSQTPEFTTKARVTGKADAWASAADMLEEAIRRAKEVP